MTAREIDDRGAGFLLILLLLISVYVLKGAQGLFVPETTRSCGEKEFVQITGEIARPGVYGFCRPPDLESLLIKGGGLSRRNGNASLYGDAFYRSGAWIDVRSEAGGPLIVEGEMSAFYKVTLGIPVSLNRESLEGLTAVPGIGRGIASAIVRERGRRGGFERKDDLLFVYGIGPALYRKLSSYLVL